MNIKKVKEKIKKEIDILTSNENFLESFQEEIKLMIDKKISIKKQIESLQKSIKDKKISKKSYLDFVKKLKAGNNRQEVNNNNNGYI